MTRTLKGFGMPYWVRFLNRKPGCIEALPSEDVRQIAMQIGAYASHSPIPYPASPVLRRIPGDTHPCPPFCTQPEMCKNCGSCPRDYSCTE